MVVRVTHSFDSLFEGPTVRRLKFFTALVSLIFSLSDGEATVDKWALWCGPTQLRGANIYQRRVYPELDGPTFMGSGPVGPPYTQQDFDRLAALGANYVNVSHPGLFTEASPYTLDPGIEENLDNLLDMIAEADMFAVISFRTGPGRSEFTFLLEDLGVWFDASYLNDSMWNDEEAQNAWVEMWRTAAEQYRGSPVVVGYDLMVEPNANEVGSDFINDRLDIWDPQEFRSEYGGTLYDWNGLFPRITAAIREVDPDTPILVGGMGYSAIDWLSYVEPTGDPRTVYTIHQYAPFVYTHQDAPATHTYPGVFDTDWDGDDDEFNRTWLEDLLSRVDAFAATHGVVVAANEFGVVRWVPNAADFMDDEMGLFEQRGMNYALWLWETSWPPYAEEVDAFNFRHGPDPASHSDVQSSDLMDSVTRNWGRNTLRPSDGACRMFLSSPNGGEVWCIGDDEDITWTSYSTSGNVQIEYSSDGGATWQTVIESTPDDGSFPWVMLGTSSTNCLVRICDRAEPDCCDTTDSSFQMCTCGTIEIRTENLPNGIEGCAYEHALSASGGCPPYAWSIASGRLPGGLTVGSSSGTISGQPNEIGVFAFTVRVSDVVDDGDLRDLSLQIDEYVDTKGDANGDCTVNVLDVVLVVHTILEMVEPTLDEQRRADCNGPPGSCDGDGEVNVLDAIKIVTIILGLDACP